MLENVKLALRMGIDEPSKYVVIEDDTCWVILCPKEKKNIKCFSESLSNGYVIFSEVMTTQGLIKLKDK